jgi:hypothetical protein
VARELAHLQKGELKRRRPHDEPPRVRHEHAVAVALEHDAELEHLGDEVLVIDDVPRVGDSGGGGAAERAVADAGAAVRVDGEAVPRSDVLPRELNCMTKCLLRPPAQTGLVCSRAAHRQVAQRLPARHSQ